jgi:hypothetical protein
VELEISKEKVADKLQPLTMIFKVLLFGNFTVVAVTVAVV